MRTEPAARGPGGPGGGPRWGSRRRRTIGAVVLALGSLTWILLRAARKPSRLAYPCQQAALLNVSLLLGIPVAHWIRCALASRRRGSAWTGAGLTAAFVLVVAMSGLTDPRAALSSASPGADATGIPPDYVAVLHVVENAGGPSGLHHLGVDKLIACMGADGQAFYRSPLPGPESGPDGIVGANDVVLVKINCQWSQRGGTNTDVLKGLIAKVLEHPDGFTGEVVVVENTQGAGTMDWSQANAEDTSQSALDVVNLFATLGEPVSAFSWDTIRATSVAEYSAGNYQDGYVVGPTEPDVSMKVSYPKFRTTAGTYVSLKYGIWNPIAGTYDNSRLKFLNVPILKCHGAVYGVTAATKHHVGTMTTTLTTNTHAAVRYGGLGKFLAQVRMADLNILDCIWILARPDLGPSCTYAQATRLDYLVAGKDPVALDFWATKYLLVPAIQANGYTSWPKQDPDNPSSVFRVYLDATLAQLVAAGIPATRDPARIDARSCSALDAGPVPAAPGLRPRARPNPFADATVLEFQAPASSATHVVIHDVAGRVVRTLDSPPQAGLARRAPWDGRDDAGRPCPSGTYYWRARGDGVDAAGKVTLVR